MVFLQKIIRAHDILLISRISLLWLLPVMIAWPQNRVIIVERMVAVWKVLIVLGGVVPER